GSGSSLYLAKNEILEHMTLNSMKKIIAPIFQPRRSLIGSSMITRLTEYLTLNGMKKRSYSKLRLKLNIWISLKRKRPVEKPTGRYASRCEGWPRLRYALRPKDAQSLL